MSRSRATILALTIALGLLAVVSLTGCRRGPVPYGSVAQLTSSARAGAEVRVVGLVTSEPSDGRTLELHDSGDEDSSVLVISQEPLPNSFDDNGPKGLAGRKVIAIGEYDGHILHASKLIFQQFQTYEAPARE